MPYLDIKPADFVRAGEFLKEAPKGIGHIQGGKDPKVGFVEGDTVYLSLRKEIPPGQLLGVYRVRGPIDSPGKRSVSGYVKYLIGVIQAGPNVDGQTTARVRQSFEDLTRADLISEEIPAYTPVRIDPGADGIPSSVITGRLENKELAQGDFIYLDQGASAGVAVGNVFRLFVPTGAAAGASSSASGEGPVRGGESGRGPCVAGLLHGVHHQQLGVVRRGRVGPAGGILEVDFPPSLAVQRRHDI